MSVRTTIRSVTFHRPFMITGVDREQPAGTYVLETDEEPIESLSFVAYRRIASRIRLSADPARPGIVETVDVTPAEIDAALVQG